MATRRTRRPTARRTTKSSADPVSAGLIAFLLVIPVLVIGGLAKLSAAAWREMTDDQRRDAAGLGLWALAVAVVASMAFPHPGLLAGVQASTLRLVGYGWPGIVGALVAVGFLLIHPAPAKGLKRYQGIALGLAGWFWLGLVALWWGAGGLLGSALSANLAMVLGGAGASIALLAALGVALVFARGVRLAEIPGRVVAAVRTRSAAPKAVAVVPPAAATALQPSPAAPAPSPRPVELESGREAAAAPSQAEASIAPEQAEHLAQGAVVDGALSPRPTDESRPTSALLEPPEAPVRMSPEEAGELVDLVEGLLASINIPATVRDVIDAPSSVQIALELAAGVRVAKLTSAMDDLRVGLATPNLLLRKPIPGTKYIGLEMPRETTQIVRLRTVVEAPEFWRQALPLALGAGPGGEPVVVDLAELPHLAVGGETGSGKSVGVNAMILGLVLRHGPETLWLVLIDPKQGVELGAYAELPHLAMPIVTDPSQAQAALQVVAVEMDRRYAQIRAVGEDLKNIAEYNAWAGQHGKPLMPYGVVVVDELADLMKVTDGEVEDVIVRLAQKARAAGIHLILATQSPRKEVMTGLIKMNVPGRVAYAVGSGLESRIILDAMGAETLKGRGDMLVTVGSLVRARAQGAFPSKADTKAVIDAWAAIGPPGYVLAPDLADGPDPLLARAARKVAGDGGSFSAAVLGATLQGALGIPASRADRLVGQLVGHGVLAATNGRQAREVLMDGADVDELLERLGVES